MNLRTVELGIDQFFSRCITFSVSVVRARHHFALFMASIVMAKASDPVYPEEAKRFALDAYIYGCSLNALQSLIDEQAF
jgi:hypothetical protein